RSESVWLYDSLPVLSV
ncbi:hypothetical protein D030_1401B, partial [Vibrio parahaemolyticus AQ3810]